jgi:glycine hydroxymethyltransferase
VDENGYIDYDEVREKAKDHKPKLIWAGFSAYSRVIDWEKFREIADEVGAILAVDIAHVAGLVVTGDYPSPIPYADVVTTTTHKTLRGPRGAMIMCKEQYAQDIDKAVFPGIQGGPHNHTTAAIAVALKEASQPEFNTYIKQVVQNSKKLCEALKIKGYEIISGGTDNHLMLIDTVKSVGLSGKEVGLALEKANITVNKNAIPNDTREPWDPSGIRIGTPAVTTRGMKEPEMDKIADFIDKVLKDYQNEEVISEIREEIKQFTTSYPIPGIN